MTKENFNKRICIVGGGPSGISAAYFLEEKGYTDITILEKEDRVGGKCFSPIYRGKHFEMGAGIGDHAGMVESLMNKCGIESDQESPHILDSDARTGEFTGAFPFISAEEMPEFKTQMNKMKELLETKYKGYNTPGHTNTHPDLMETFEDFCNTNGVPLCTQAWLKPCTSFGYGYFNHVPAAYILQYMDWDNMLYIAKGEFTCWKDGTQGLWEKIALKLNRYPRLSTNIKRIVRKDNKIFVTSELGTEDFDTIIFASPLQHLEKYVDISEETKDLFSKIITQDYKTFAFTPVNKPEHSAFLNGNLDVSKPGHPMFYYNRWEDEKEQIITTYIMGNKDEKIGEEECLKILKEDMAIQNIGVKDIVMHRTWEYFPHINGFEMKHSWYEKVEAMQGKDNTYFAGEIMNFSDMEQCATYSKKLTENFF